MKYKPLTSAEFAILSLVGELRSATGYELSRLIRDRGYRNWTDVGTTSVYNSLKSLQRRGCLTSRISDEKSGKGPPPRVFTIAPEGEATLRREVIEALRIPRGDARFDLALASLPVADATEIVAALENRRSSLEGALSAMEGGFTAQGGEALPFHVRALFAHNRRRLQTEIDFIADVIGEIPRSR